MSSKSNVTVAVIQAPFADALEVNVERAEGLVRQAAGEGAEVILLPELFEGPYFPREEKGAFFEWARPVEGHPTLERMSQLAAELEVVLPISFFERDGNAYYNSLVVLDADGTSLGLYRKSHIPEGPGYQEKFYFRPGDTGFKVWETRHAALGVGICWDQWFPEAARAMALAGAEVLLYPTAIGSEPAEPELDTRDAWQRVMQGHAIANLTPVAAANRVGDEEGQVFYGSSFLTDGLGEIREVLDREETGVALREYDLAALRAQRASWGFFRDRRPDLYGRIVG
ncbi:MAG: N-carbamoylputrescine amidase [Deltaproteobacteria bacterium]|nr:N-carbamoylputrescine amidase [Deltaproteobacteria bacterium]